MKDNNLPEHIQQCINGDKNAFRSIMENYSDYVFALALQIINNEDDAKDVVQETFIRIWKNLASYNTKVKFTTWIYKITHNLCIDHLRKMKRNHILSGSENELLKRVLSDDDPARILGNKEVNSILMKLSENLSPKQKSVFILQDIQELNPEEIKLITGMTKGQIKSNIWYARKEIKKQLIKIGYDL